MILLKGTCVLLDIGCCVRINTSNEIGFVVIVRLVTWGRLIEACIGIVVMFRAAVRVAKLLSIIGRADSLGISKMFSCCRDTCSCMISY